MHRKTDINSAIFFFFSVILYTPLLILCPPRFGRLAKPERFWFRTRQLLFPTRAVGCIDFTNSVFTFHFIACTFPGGTVAPISEHIIPPFLDGYGMKYVLKISLTSRVRYDQKCWMLWYLETLRKTWIFHTSWLERQIIFNF